MGARRKAIRKFKLVSVYRRAAAEHFACGRKHRPKKAAYLFNREGNRAWDSVARSLILQVAGSPFRAGDVAQGESPSVNDPEEEEEEEEGDESREKDACPSRPKDSSHSRNRNLKI